MSQNQFNVAGEKARKHPREVWFSGSTSLCKGQGVCYERDRVTTSTGQTATDNFGGRDSVVELPNGDNCDHFAGVTAKAYPAVSGGQNILIWEPGSVCEIATLVATTVGSTVLTACRGASAPGLFALQGFPGKGTAKALQTTATAGTTDIGPLGVAWDGGGSLVSSTLTLSDTGAFANAVAGDYIYVFGGMIANDIDSQVTPGFHKIASVTSDDAVVLETSPHTVAGTQLITYALVRCSEVTINGVTVVQPPTVLALLDDGPPSGLVHIYNTYGGAVTDIVMKGWTFFCGGMEPGETMTMDLAEATDYGRKVGLKLLAALTTDNIDLDFATHGYQRAVNSSTHVPEELAALEFDGAGDVIVVQWDGKWRELWSSGVALATS